MQQWECIVCGWIYDEKIGDPDSGIAPGTKFEDIPDDWLCPECGVGKDDFELVDIPSTTSAAIGPSPQQSTVTTTSNSVQIDTHPIVIIGAGLAGYGLLKEFRKLNPYTPITIICADSGGAYSKPALSTGFTKNTSAQDLCQASAVEMATRYNANILTQTTVSSIDANQQLITLNNRNGLLHYSKLVLALGAECIAPPLQGNALDRVFTINDLADFAAFQEAIEQHDAREVCILGAGLIGCEYANDLANGNIKTTTIDPMPTCLASLLPPQAGRAVELALRNNGGEFHFGKTVSSIDYTYNEKALTISLNDGSTLNADLVLSAIGVRPRINLAKESGIITNQGISVNRLLETNIENIYAFGDCAEVDGHVLVYVAPLVAASRALAATLNGTPTKVIYPAMPIAIKTPVCPVVVCPPRADDDGEWVIESQEGNNVKAVYENRQGEVFGFALTGNCISQRADLVADVPAIFD